MVQEMKVAGVEGFVGVVYARNPCSQLCFRQKHTEKKVDKELSFSESPWVIQVMHCEG